MLPKYPSRKRCTVLSIRLGPVGSLWIALLVSTGTVAAARSVPAQTGSLRLDDAWFASLARAESLMTEASCRGEVDSADRAALVEQIRIGVRVLDRFVCASIVADTALASPLATVRPRDPPAHRWGHRILMATGGISAIAGLVHLLASLNGASPQTGGVLAFVGASAAGVGGVFNRLLAGQPSRPATDAFARMRTLDLETNLCASIDETERAAASLWVELRGIAVDSCATDAQVVRFARRYANALLGATVIVDSRIARSSAIARSCAECPGFAMESRERCEALASHLDALAALWQERRWLFERSSRSTFDFLVLADRP